MLLIDILNGLSFGGADFDSAIAAARTRRRFLNPVLRKVLEYAAQNPQAYQCRFSESLLASAAFLLSEAKDPAFLKLVAPLIDADAEPWLLGHLPEDPTRLIAGGLGSRFDELATLVKDGEFSDQFYASAFDALALTALWEPASRLKVISVLRSFLRADCLGGFEPDVRVNLVECCCRLDPRDFLLDLQLAIDRGELEEKVANDLFDDASQRARDVIWFDDWTSTTRLAVEDMFLQQYRRIFVAKELCFLDGQTAPDSDALALFNSIATPSRGYIDRVMEIQVTPALMDVCCRVVGLATAWPSSFRERHHPIAISVAICLAAPIGDETFTRHLGALLRISEENLDQLLWDDVTEMCDSALAISGRFAPNLIREVVEDQQACGVVRSVALGALMRQVDLGYRQVAELAQYCRDLVARKAEIGKQAWVWGDVVTICGRLNLKELEPELVRMIAEGYFVDERGDPRLDEEEIAEEFANPTVDRHPPSEISTKTLLRRSYDNFHRRVGEFFGCLEPPKYNESTEMESAGES